MANQKAQLEFEVTAPGVKQSLDEIKDGFKQVGQAARENLKDAGVALDEIAKAGSASEKQVTNATRNLEASIKRATTLAVGQLTEIAGAQKGTAEAFAIRAEALGIDPGKLATALEPLRQVEASIRAVELAQQELAAASAFDKMASDAAKLNKASEYARWWANALDEAELSAKKLAASNQLLEASQEKLGRQMAINAKIGQANVQALQQKYASERKAQDDFIKGLEREVMMLNMSAAEWKAYQAAQLGIGDRAAPLIRQLEQSSKGMNQLGLNAKETTWALRQVPAQFTDIVVSLQGGQAPMTVLLQQGGQLKDMFGGIGNAARALGGYIAGLITPLNLAIAGTAAMAFAYEKGASEARNLEKALILSGNAAGTTGSELQAMAAKVAEATGATQSSVSAAVAGMAESGKISKEVMETASAAAINFNRAAGTAIEDTVKQFEKLSKEPTAALVELNQQYRFLTAEIYEQVKALEQQGEVSEAAKLAAEAYADAINRRSAQIVANVGWMEAAWNGLAKVAKSAWDQMLGIGRSSGAQGAADAAYNELMNAQNTGARQYEIDALETKYKRLQKAADDAAAAERGIALAQKESQDTANARIRLSEAADKTDKKILDQRKELLSLTNSYEKALIGATDAEKKLLEQQYLKGVQGILGEGKETRSPSGRAGAGFDLRDKQLEYLHKQADAEAKLNEKRQATIAILEQTTEALEKTFGRQNEIFEQRNLSAGEKELADNLRKVKEEADKARKALADKFASMKQDETVLAQYRIELEKVSELERDQAINVMDQAATKQLERGSWVKGAKDALTEYSEAANNVAENTKQAFAGAFKSMEDGLVQFVKTGKLEFRSFATSILEDMIRMAARKGISNLLGAAASSGPFGWLGDMFGALAGTRAAGGPIESGKSYLVGEQGPEIITAGANGFVTPNHALGGTTNNVSIVVNADGSGRNETGENEAAQLGRRIDAAVRAVLMTEKRPGGMLA